MLNQFDLFEQHRLEGDSLFEEANEKYPDHLPLHVAQMNTKENNKVRNSKKQVKVRQWFFVSIHPPTSVITQWINGAGYTNMAY